MTSLTNPYVGPRTFTEKDGEYYFGREQEARDLTARIVSERLLLFYAQSGAGKSSLINTRVIPRLRDGEGFIVLPVGRVSGDLPPGMGIEAVDNIYAFNLMNSLDQSSDNPGQLAGVCLNDFLARLALEKSVDEDGQQEMRWVYKPEIEIDRDGEKPSASGPRFILVIDQFEEIVTSHPDHWQEREAFFRQLNEALVDDPNLWVVLTLREDYIAALDPYAPLVLNRMRARFYMERMDEEGALEAVREPAEIGERPFAPGVAEQLVNDLRQVRVPGSDETVPSQYVEPVQLQVVCYQMWENLEDGEGGEQISSADLAAAGDVDQALTEFYEDTLDAVLAEPESPRVDERQLRRWFDRDLITAAGTRGLVHMGNSTTAGLPNEVVRLLQERFLVRTELRAGATWVELVHDRFVKPIHESNSAWFDENLSVLQRQALLWDREEQPPDLLLRGEALRDAENWADEQGQSLQTYENDFLKASKAADQEATTRDQRRTKLIIALLAALTVIVASGAAVSLWASNDRSETLALNSRLEADQNKLAAEVAEKNAELAKAEAEAAEQEAARIQEEAVLVAQESADRATRAAVSVESAAEAAAMAQNDRAMAVAAQAEAEAAGTVAAGALATSAANLELAFTILTRQASELVVGSGDTVEVQSPIIVEGPAPTATATPGIGIASVPDETATPTVESSPSPPPEETPNSEVDQLLAQIAEIEAAQTRLASEPTATSEAIAAPKPDVIANWMGMTVHSAPEDNASVVVEVAPWERAQVLDSQQGHWLEVETKDGTRGWVDGRWRVFEGNGEALPGALSYRVISERDDLPFVYGQVIASPGARNRYQLRFQADPYAEEIIEVPLATEVLVLLADQGANGDWLLVTLADVDGDGLIRTGYLPQNVVGELGPDFSYTLANGVEASYVCPGAARPRIKVGDRARVTFTDGSSSGIRPGPAAAQVDGLIPEGTGMRVVDGPDCSNRLLWWYVETDKNLTGWTPEGKTGDYWLEPVEGQ